jgi:hypothetical protein
VVVVVDVTEWPRRRVLHGVKRRLDTRLDDASLLIHLLLKLVIRLRGEVKP